MKYVIVALPGDEVLGCSHSIYKWRSPINEMNNTVLGQTFSWCRADNKF